MRRAITITWDPDTLDDPEVALGVGVSVPEAHHILIACADAIDDVCPVPRVTRNGVALLEELVEEIEGDEDA